MIIRTAKIGDANYALNIAKLLKKEYRHVYPHSEKGIRHFIKKGLCVLAIDNKKVVGFGCMHRFRNFTYKKKRLIEMQSLVIKKEYRRRGICTSIIKKLLGESSKKFRNYIVFATTDNKITQKIFLKKGFKRLDFEALGNNFVDNYCTGCGDYKKCNKNDGRNKVCQLFIKKKDLNP